jgi:rhodanese-related sulfurtransferase
VLASCEVMEIQVNLDRFPGARLIDVREPHEYSAGHIPGIEHVPMDQLGSLDVAPGETIVFVCLSGGRSGMAAVAFQRHGVEAYSLDGGMLSWAAGGGELEPPGGYVAPH